MRVCTHTQNIQKRERGGRREKEKKILLNINIF